MRKICKAGAVAMALVMLLAGCGGEQMPVPVVKVSMLARAGTAGDSYAGVVVSEKAVEIVRDKTQTIEELYVAEDDTVRKGQPLFSYDANELNLTKSKQQLELQRIDAELKEKKAQVAEVEKELKTATGDLKTQLNIQLRQLDNELTELEYERDDLNEDLSYTKELIRNVVVQSPSDGTVRSIDEDGEVYITIQQAGALQVQGMLNELNLNGGIALGAKVEVVSRLDPELYWTGTVTALSYNTTLENGYDSQYGSVDPLSSSVSYPFYVTLDSVEGLLLGQHVYIRLAPVNSGSTGRVLVPDSYLVDYAYDKETMITSAAVWCPDEEGRLARRSVVLGEYKSDIGCYVILEGLSLEDYVADPTNPDCRTGALTDLRSETDFGLNEILPTDGTDPTGQTGDTVPGSAEQTEKQDTPVPGVDKPAGEPEDDGAEG